MGFKHISRSFDIRKLEYMSYGASAGEKFRLPSYLKLRFKVSIKKH